jgi:hypothetical protein
MILQQSQQRASTANLNIVGMRAETQHRQLLMTDLDQTER